MLVRAVFTKLTSTADVLPFQSLTLIRSLFNQIALSRPHALTLLFEYFAYVWLQNRYEKSNDFGRAIRNSIFSDKRNRDQCFADISTKMRD